MIFVILSACSQESDNPPNENVVARIGDTYISHKDFVRSIWLEPQYAIRTPVSAAYQNQVRYLINNEYYYRTGMAAGLDKEPDIVNKSDYIKQQEILKGFIQENFLDTARVSDQELRSGLQRSAKKVHVFNIFSKSEQEIDRHERLVRNKSVSPVDYFLSNGEDLGWIGFGDLDPEIEKAVFDLKPGQVSAVVRSSYGFHLLLQAEEAANPDFQNISDGMKLENVTEIIRKRKVHRSIQDLLKQLSGGQKIAINNRLVNKMAAQFNALEPNEPADPQLMVPPLSNGELRRIEVQIGDIRGETMAKLGERQMTVGEFIDRLALMPPFHRPYLKGHSRLQQGVIDMLRQDLLVDEAVRRGFDEKESIKILIKQNVAEMIGDEFRKRYVSKDFQTSNPETWQEYDRQLNVIKAENPAQIYDENLIKGVRDPDSVITNAPIPVLLKNRYVW